MDLTTIFCHVDDFCKQYHKQIQKNILPDSEYESSNRGYSMGLSEIMSVLIYHGVSSKDFKTFKAFYNHTYHELRDAFPHILSYGRLTELKDLTKVPMTMFLMTLLGQCTEISFADSTKIEACGIKRVGSHKTLKRLAAKGKTGSGWFYGTKLHVVLNHLGEIVNFLITPGNFADNNKGVIDHLTQGLFGKMYTDKGYLLNPEAWQELYRRGIQIVHDVRKNMKPKIMPLADKLLLSKRPSIMEGCFSILKDRLSLQYTKHRSIYGFLSHIISMLIAYQLRPTKPSVNLADFIYDKSAINENLCSSEKTLLITAF